MSGIMSLESSIRTCKVNAGYSERINSDRFLNPKNTVCPVWNQLDAAGRVACADSFWTKSPGCNSARDRVNVENVLRPQYMQYISDSLGMNYNNNSALPGPASVTPAPGTTLAPGAGQPTPNVGVTEGFMDFDTPAKDYSKITGSTGLQLDGIVWPRTCSYTRYDDYSDMIMKGQQ